MSNQKVKTSLADYPFGPYFLGLDELQELYGTPKSPVDGQTLDHTMLRIVGTSYLRFQAMTTDSYTWYRTLYIKPGAKRFALLMPHTTDKNLVDGTTTDRHIALYANYEMSEQDQLNFASMFTAEVKDQLKFEAKQLPVHVESMVTFPLPISPGLRRLLFILLGIVGAIVFLPILFAEDAISFYTAFQQSNDPVGSIGVGVLVCIALWIIFTPRKKR